MKSISVVCIFLVSLGVAQAARATGAGSAPSIYDDLALVSVDDEQNQQEFFKVQRLPHWRKVLDEESAVVFRNVKSRSNETVTLQSFPLAEPLPGAEQIPRILIADENALREVGKLRESLFKRFGLDDYAIISTEVRPVSSGKFTQVQLIQSRFVAGRDTGSHEVQSLERQYVFAGRMYVVTYLIDAPALNDRAAAERAMNLFVPQVPKRTPASASETKAAFGSARLVGVHAKDESGPTQKLDKTGLEAKLREINMADPAAQNTCKDVPQERRRQAGEPGFMEKLATVAAAPRNCFSGVINNIWRLIKISGVAAWEGMKYAASSDYRNQVNASFGALASEVEKSPLRFAQRVGREFWTWASKEAGVFFDCLNTGEQIKIVCDLASNLVPPGMLVKVVTKAPMTVEELSKMNMFVKNAVGLVKNKPDPYSSVPDRYQITGGSSKNELARAAELMKEKHNGLVYVEKFDESKKTTRGYSSQNWEGRPTLVMPSGAENSPVDQVGTIWHEATHVSNSARASKGQALGEMRTSSMHAPADGSYELKGLWGSYKEYVRMDEIHARAVQSGVQLDRAEKLLKTGDVRNADLLLKDADRTLYAAEEMRKASDLHYKMAINGLRNPSSPIKVSYIVEGGTKARIQVPIKFFSDPEMAARYRDFAARNPGVPNPHKMDKVSSYFIELHVPPNLQGEDLKAKSLEFLQKSQADYQRFDKAFAANGRRLKALRNRIGVRPEPEAATASPSH